MRKIKILVVHTRSLYNCQDEYAETETVITSCKDTEWKEVTDDEFEIYKKVCDGHDKYNDPLYILVEDGNEITLEQLKKEYEKLEEKRIAQDKINKLNEESRKKNQAKIDLRRKEAKEAKERKQLEKLATKLGIPLPVPDVKI